MKFTEHYITEEKQTDDYVVVYSGRMQPFHSGHKQVFDHLVDKFGKDKVYIATSNKVELPEPNSKTFKEEFNLGVIKSINGYVTHGIGLKLLSTGSWFWNDSNHPISFKYPLCFCEINAFKTAGSFTKRSTVLIFSFNVAAIIKNYFK